MITVGIRLADAQNMEIQCNLFTKFKNLGYQGLFSKVTLHIVIFTFWEIRRIIIRWDKITKILRMRKKRKITMLMRMRMMRIMSGEKHSEAATH